MTTGASIRFYYALLGAGGGFTAPVVQDEDDIVQSLVDRGLVTKVWEYQTPFGEQCYSSPIGPVNVYAGSGGIANQVPAVLFTSWDWHLYALNAATGALLWRRASGNTCYGRPQAGDVNGDGYNELFFPSHDGNIWSVESDGVLRWQFPNLYAREGTGTITGADQYYMEDSTKAWAENSFMREIGPSTLNAYIRFLDGPNAFVPGTADPDTGIAPTDRHISQNNEGTRLWISDPWAVTPNVGDSYQIMMRYPSDGIFMHAGTLVKFGANDWRLFCTGFDNMVYCINADTGALIWKYATQENIEPYPLVYYNGGACHVYVVSIDGKTRMLEGFGGTLLTETPTGQCDAFLSMHLTSGASGNLFVSSRDDRTYRVNNSVGIKTAQSTAGSAWDYGDKDSSSIVFQLPGTTGTANMRVVVGGDDGGLWCFDYDLRTKWVYPCAPTAINSSPILHNVTGKANELAVLVADMRGTVHCNDVATGKSLGKLYHKGGIEGMPLYADIDGDGKMELVTTTTDGWVTCWRFNNGVKFEYGTGVLPGNARWTGKQEIMP